MSPLMSPPPLTLCPAALVPHMGGGQIPPMSKQPRENPGCKFYVGTALGVYASQIDFFPEKRPLDVWGGGRGFRVVTFL